MRSGCCGLRQLDRVRDVVGADERAVVDVGEEADAQAVERGRQAGHRQRRLGDADLVAFVGRRRRCAAPVDRADAPSASTPLMRRAAA